MSWLPFVVSGLVAGSIYGIAAMGLVVTYRTTGLFNFAHGAVGMAVAYCFYVLRDEMGVPTALALLLCLVVIAPLIGAAVDRLFSRAADGASQATKVVVTMALLITLQGLAVAVFGAMPKRFAPILPTGTFRIASVAVGWDQVIVIALGVVILAGLTVFFRRSRAGTAMRAMVDDRDLARAAGFSATRIGVLTWSLGVATAGLAGILFSPLLGLDSVILTLLVVQAYAAAIFGRLTSLPRTFVAALALGLAGSLVLRALGSHPTLLNGLRPSIPFAFLFLVLVVARRGTLRELGVSAPWAGSVRASAASGRWLLLLLPLVVVLSPARVFSLGFALVIACALLSITVLTGTSGLVSLAQAGLAGVGAFAYIHLTGAGVPFWLALPAAGLAVIPLGIAIAVPALRLSGLFLALATFAVGQLIDGLLFSTWTWFSGAGDGLRGGRPSVLESDRLYVAFVILVLVGLVALVGAMRRTGLGRSLVALRDSPQAATSLGMRALWPRVAVFSVSAFIAGVAGGLYAGLLQAASGAFFNTFTSLLWLTITVVGGVEHPYGAVVAALLFYFVPDLASSGGPASPWLTPAFGVAALVLASRPGGLVGWVAERLPGRLVAVAPRADGDALAAVGPS
ncbi:MAG TPA: ABC transporter permease [Acidimicrobiales bacterium]|jgi:branched-subunit amino acid ABC-type transport system permease component|nr:ABC transporter permease [Acidimicrobiales bacterium]